MAFIKLYTDLKDHTDLSASEKIIYSIINNYGTEGCFASDKYFSEWISRSEDQAKRAIKSLEEKGYIKRFTKGTHRKIVVRKMMTDKPVSGNAQTVQEIITGKDQTPTKEKSQSGKKPFIPALYVMDIDKNLKLGLRLTTTSAADDFIEAMNLEDKSEDFIKSAMLEYALKNGTYKPP